MKFPSLFKHKDTTSATTSTTTLTQQPPWQWQWPSCNHPKTLSFRASGDDHHNMFKTVNTVFFDPNISDVVLGVVDETPESTSNTNWFTNSSSSDHESTSFTTESRDRDHPEYYFDGERLETVVRGARSERLFFEPEDTSSIFEIKGMKLGGEKLINLENPFEESSVVLAMESEDPYGDFRRSMEEMVESHGLRDWECLEELLGWYLRVNKKMNHGFIVGAFVDLLANYANANHATSSSSTDAAATSFSSAAATSFSSSPPLMCSFQGHNTDPDWIRR